MSIRDEILNKTYKNEVLSVPTKKVIAPIKKKQPKKSKLTEFVDNGLDAVGSVLDRIKNFGNGVGKVVKKIPEKVVDVVSNPKEAGIGFLKGVKDTAEDINTSFDEKVGVGLKALFDPNKKYNEVLEDYRKNKTSNSIESFNKKYEDNKKTNVLNFKYTDSNTFKKAEKGELTKQQEEAYNMGQTSGRIGTAILGAALTRNANVGKLIFGTATQQSYQEQARAEGKNELQSIIYSIPMTVAETYLEGKLGVGFGLKPNSLLRTSVEEGLEEFVMPFIDSAVKTIGFGDDFDLQKTTKEAINSAIDGAVMGIIMQGATNVVPNAQKVMNKIQNKEKVTSQEIKQAVEDTQNKLGEDVLGQTIEKVVQETNAQMPNLKDRTQTNVQDKAIAPIKQEQALNVPQMKKNEVIKSESPMMPEPIQKNQVDLTIQNVQSRIPTRIGKETSKLQKNVETSPIVDAAFSKLAPNLTYDPISNVGTMAEAKRKLDSDLDGEVVRLFNIEPTKATVTDVTELIQLQYNYQKQGNIRSFQETINKLREIGTSAGQSVQAFAIMQRMTPEGMVYYAQKDLQDLFETVSENKSKKWIEENKDKYNLTDEDMVFIKDKMVELQSTKDVRQRQIILGQVQKLVNDKIPSDIGREIKSFRRISMLFNPKTQIRNIVGNTSILPLNVASDFIGSGIDKLISKKTGVRTVAPYKAKEYVKGAKQGVKTVVEDYKLGIDTSTIQGDRFEIGRGNNFNNDTVIGKSLNKVDKLNSMMLRMGDNPFFEAEFNNSLQNQLKINKVEQPTADMVEVATQTALERTWQDNNKYTQAVIGIRNILNKVNVKGFGLGDVIIPFAKTPANITKAMVDYSPVGLVKSLTFDLNKFKNNVETNNATPQLQRQLVTNMAKGMTGTLVYLMAYGLRDLISGGADEDKDIRDFMRNTMGVNPYSFKIGDKTFTYDWIQPMSTPFAIVADSKNQEGSIFEKTIKTIGTAGDRLIEQSFLQGIKDLFSYIGKEGTTGNIIKGITEDLPASFIPTVVKQVNDLVDGYNRQTYASDDVIGNIARSVGVKLPTSKTMAKRYDTLGQEVLKYGGDNNLFNVFLNPANVNVAKNTEVAKEILDLYKETGEKTIFPRVAPYSINLGGGEVVKLTPKEQSEFQKISGNTVNSEVKRLLKSDTYKVMSNSEKTKLLENMVGYAYNKARKEVLDIKMPDEYNKVNEYIENGGRASEYYEIDTLNSNIRNDETLTTEKKKKQIINNILDSESDQKLFLYSKYYSSEEKINAVEKANINTNAFLELQKNIGSDSKKEDVLKQIQNLKTTRTNKLMLYAMEGYSLTEKEKTEIFNNLNNMKLSKTDKKEILKQMKSFQWLSNGNLKGW